VTGLEDLKTQLGLTRRNECGSIRYPHTRSGFVALLQESIRESAKKRNRTKR
jgi:hypothetical protein